ncbi:fluoride efflux transporter CrcB [Haloferax chudinovii]|uniref:Fluoride-specific ion channel FluC n=1 Tax=Haloferax chudinovii TaxID=1109010 RepID=A0ABD5XHL9_9EURY
MVELDPAHIVGTGGALGALLRTFVSQQVDIEEFPLGTITVNVIGSFALGLFTFVSLNNSLMLLLGTGACGSFTTFSSFSFETVRLWETGERSRATVNAVGNLIGAGLALGLAWGVAQLVT